MARLLERLILGPLPEAEEQLAAQQVRALALPAVITLAGTEVELRLADPADKPALLKFARALPPEDLLFLRRDITRPEHIDAWFQEIREGRTTTVLAWHDSAIAGYATVAREGLPWTAHVAELRILVAPAWRGRRLGRVLVDQAFAIAREAGVAKMVAQMTESQRAAQAVFKRFGFRDEAVLRGHVQDREGRLHDLHLMSLDVGVFRARVTAMELTVLGFER